ncbi:MAG: lipoyl protein ligase domain-containing protein, partial [Acidimicrobiales bacterium]
MLGRSVPPDDRSVLVGRVSSSALVLGSTQPEGHVDHQAARSRGVRILRRRSGGGAVLLRPGEVVWTEVFIPADDPLGCRDVGRAFWWLGEVWQQALMAIGAQEVEVHRGRIVSTAWSPWACFAGMGPGEVLVAGRKVVGMAQRRWRAGSLFQCAALIGHDPAFTAELFDLDDSSRLELCEQLGSFAAGVGDLVDHDQLVRSFLA